MRLLDASRDIPVLAPLIRRELHYRLLQGDQQGRLAEIAIGDGRLRRVAGAIQEARTRLLAGATSAEAVAYQVGYASASQFSREYARLFGQPPRRDAEAMRGEPTALPKAARMDGADRQAHTSGASGGPSTALDFLHAPGVRI